MRGIPTDAAALRWLAHLVRVAAGGARAGDLFDDELPFDTELVLRAGIRHRVAPLLHRAMEDGRIGDALPEEFRAACRRLYYATLRRNVVALEAGEEILAALHARGLDAAPLKGWAFLMPGVPDAAAPPPYEDPGTRPMDDLDFIVRPGDRADAEAALESVGFVALRPDRRASHAAGHEVAFHRRDGDVDVFAELHWAWAGEESLLRGFALRGDQFLDRFCLRAVASGRPAATRLGHLVFTAVHGARHAFERWIWLHDLHRLVTMAPLDWDEVLDAARDLRVRGPLYAALSCARSVLRTPVPKEVMAALAPGLVRRRLLERSLAVAQREGSGRRPARVAKLLLGESWWDVARTAAWAVRPGAAWYEARGEGPAARPQRAAPVVAGGSR